MRATGCYQFRVTRNSNPFVDEEEIDDPLPALEGVLSSRRFGDEVRLEAGDDTPEELVRFLTVQFELHNEAIYYCICLD